MIKRILVAVPIVAVALAAIVLGGWVLRAVIVVVAVVSLWEFCNALTLMGYKPFRWSVMAAALLGMPVEFFWGARPALMLLAVCVMLLLSVRVCSAQYSFADIAVSAAAFLYPLLPYALVTAMLRAPSGSFLVLMIVAYAVLTDTFAYFAGSLLGKHKMCAHISPKKTWEGAAGGIFGALASGTALYALQALGGLALAWYHYIVMGALCGVAAQLGDLFASTIKREAKIKDFGRCFPGHGGMLDRVDSILFTIPVVFVYGACIGIF